VQVLPALGPELLVLLLGPEPPEPLVPGLLEPLHHEGCHFPEQIFQPAQTSPRQQLVR
jgi:hypothetical protein